MPVFEMTKADAISLATRLSTLIENRKLDITMGLGGHSIVADPDDDDVYTRLVIKR